MPTTITKAEELAAVQQLAEHLGPDSYLGPWLADALPWLADQLASDLIPQPASQLQQQAARAKAEACCDAIAIRQAASLEARQLLERCHQQQEKAASEVEQIKGRAWDALRQAMKTLEV